jgi:hypothetical protein
MDYSSYVLEIQEIEGKNIVKKYLGEVVEHCKRLDLFCTIEIIPDDDEIDPSLIVGGGSTTFPYNLFESLADRMNIAKAVNQQGRKGIVDRLFSFFNKNKDLQEDSEKRELLGIDYPKEIDESYIHSLKNITGIVRILIRIRELIEDVKENQSLYELENRLKK